MTIILRDQTPTTSSRCDGTHRNGGDAGALGSRRLLPLHRRDVLSLAVGPLLLLVLLFLLLVLLLLRVGLVLVLTETRRESLQCETLNLPARN